jgi:hypothetical protein
MNEASRWRLAMARVVAPVYAADARVRAVLVGGSVARGWADRYSDVEIGVFWEQFPTAQEFRAAIERARGTDWQLEPYTPEEDVWYEEYAVDGLKIDLRHMTAARMSEVLAAVTVGGDFSESRQEIIAAMQHGVPLHGAPLIEAWQASAARYPEALARAMVRKHLALPPWWSVPMLVERENLPLVYGAFREAAQGIFGALVGLNRVYYPGSKWMAQTLATLPLAPPDLAARINGVFRTEPLDGARQMKALVEETFSLVEQQMPDPEVAAARRWFRSQRPVLDAPPDGRLPLDRCG